MKKLFYTGVLAMLTTAASADDLTAVVTNTLSGTSTGSVDLTVSGGVPSYTFSWSGPSGFSASTEDISGLEAGTYTVIVTDMYCGVAVLSVEVDSSSTGVIPIKETHLLQVFPNPTQDFITIQGANGFNNAYVRILNVSGQVVSEQKTVNGQSLVMDVGFYAKGAYVVEVRMAGSISRTRFIKK